MRIKLSPKGIAYITILVYWGPFNALTYFWGFLLLFFFIFLKKGQLKAEGIYSRNIIQYALLFFLLFLTSSIVAYYINPASLNNIFWSTLTYGSVFSVAIALLLIPFKKEDLVAALKFLVYFSLIQVIVGYFQMLYGTSFQYLNPFGSGKDAGDLFVGTTFNPGIGSLVAIKLSLATLLFIPFWFQNKSLKNSIILLLLFMGWVLASALFTLVAGLGVLFFFFIFRKIVTSVFTLKLNTSVFYITILGVVASSVFFYTQRSNIEYALTSLRYSYATLKGETVKGQVSTRKVFYYRNTLTELPFEHPSMLLIGVGPGNYSSRSAWIVSGAYLESQPSYIPVTPSAIAKKYVLSVWNKDMISSKFKGAGSIMHQPFSTWLSVFAEFGIPALIVFIMFFFTFYKSFNLNHQLEDEFLQNLSLGLKISLVYLMLLFFIENLFEYPIVMGQFFVFACAFSRINNSKILGTNTSI